MRERLASDRHLHPLELGEVTEGDLAGLVAQREDHIRSRAVQRLPFPYPALQGALQRKPVHIWFLLLQMLQQRDRRQRRRSLQQRHQLLIPYPRQRIRTGPPAGLVRLRLQLVSLNPAGTAH